MFVITCRSDIFKISAMNLRFRFRKDVTFKSRCPKQSLVFLIVCILGAILVYHLNLLMPNKEMRVSGPVKDKLLDISRDAKSLAHWLGNFTNHSMKSGKIGNSSASKTTIISSSKSVMQYTKKKTSTTCINPFRSKYVTNRNFLCCQPRGGLGNHMFYCASAYGIAAHLNRTLVFNERNLFSEYFNVESKLVDDYQCVTRGSEQMVARLDCGFDVNLLKIPKGKNYCVGDFLQSYKYFENAESDIRKQFTFRQEYRDKAKRLVDDAVRIYRTRCNNSEQYTPPVLVGVHVRRDNMVHMAEFNVVTPHYMYSAAKYFRDKFPDVLFLVCSNGMDWTKKHIEGDDVVYIEGNSPGVDMSVLVSCDHTLSTVGTFSWWLGYLTGGETVYYKWPAREGSRLRKAFSKDYTDFFPPSWIGMS